MWLKVGLSECHQHLHVLAFSLSSAFLDWLAGFLVSLSGVARWHQQASSHILVILTPNAKERASFLEGLTKFLLFKP